MKETEIFYWKNETGDIEEHHISEFRTFLERGSGSCVTFVEFEQREKPSSEPASVDRALPWEVVDQGSTPEKEVISPIAIS